MSAWLQAEIVAVWVVALLGWATWGGAAIVQQIDKLRNGKRRG